MGAYCKVSSTFATFRIARTDQDLWLFSRAKPEWFRNTKLDFPKAETSRQSRKFVKAMKALIVCVPIDRCICPADRFGSIGYRLTNRLDHVALLGPTAEAIGLGAVATHHCPRSSSTLLLRSQHQR